MLVNASMSLKDFEAMLIQFSFLFFSQITTEKEIIKKPSTPTSSDYFMEQTEHEASTSVKRKKASLKNMYSE